MTVKAWLLFAATEFLLSLTPGPAVLLVISHGMRFGSRASVYGTAGILTGNAIYFALSAVGLGAVLIASASLFQAIKWLGAAYLIFIGLKMCFAAFKAYLGHTEPNGSPRQAELLTSSSPRPLQLVWQGLVTQLSNPKALVFFTALLPQFVSPGVNVPLQFLILGTTSLAVELPVLLGYGWVAERGSRLIPKGRFRAIQDGVAGTFLVAAGIGIANMRRP